MIRRLCVLLKNNKSTLNYRGSAGAQGFDFAELRDVDEKDIKKVQEKDDAYVEYLSNALLKDSIINDSISNRNNNSRQHIVSSIKKPNRLQGKDGTIPPHIRKSLPQHRIQYNAKIEEEREYNRLKGKMTAQEAMWVFSHVKLHEKNKEIVHSIEKTINLPLNSFDSFSLSKHLARYTILILKSFNV